MKSVPASKEKTEDELLDVVESGTHNKIPLGPSERRLKSRYLWISFIIMMFGMAIVGLSFGLLLNKDDTKKITEESELIAGEDADAASEEDSAEATLSPYLEINKKIFDAAVELVQRTPRQYLDMPNYGETLSYREYNIGQPFDLAMLPGLGGDDTWTALLAVLPEFQDHHIISINPVGWYGSTMNTPITNHADHADMIMDLLDSILPTPEKPVMAMGYSTGGGIAFYLALKYPERISHAFLFHSIPLDGLRFPPDFVNGGHQEFATVEQIEAVVQMQKVDDPKVWYSMLKLFSIYPELYPAEDHGMAQYLKESNMGMPGVLEATLANAAFNVCPIKTPFSDPSDVLSNLRSKIVVIHGSQDTICLAEQMECLIKLAIVERWAPEGLFSYYDDAEGHMVLLEKPSVAGNIYRKAFGEQVLGLSREETRT